MRSLILKLRRDARGATALEYGIFAAFAAIVLMSGLSSIGGSLNGTFDKAGQAMAATRPAEPSPRGDGPQPSRTADGRFVIVGDTKNHFLDDNQ